MLGLHQRRASSRTLADAYLASKRARGLSPQTLISYETWMRRFCQHFDTLPTEPQPLEAFWVRWRGITRVNAYRNVHALYAWAVRTKHIRQADNPFPYIDPPKRPKKLPRVFTDAECARILLAAAEGPERNLVLVLMDGAPRIGELAGRSKNDLTDAGIHVDGKRGERMVPLLPETIALLRAQPGRWLFPTKDHHGRWLDAPAVVNTLKHRFEAIVNRAGIDGRRRGPHTIRHTSAVKWLHSAGNIYALRDMLGHASVKETEIYAAMLNAAMLSSLHQEHSAARGVWG